MSIIRAQIRCYVCLSQMDGECLESSSLNFDGTFVECAACGLYRLSRSAHSEKTLDRFDQKKRALLSHILRKNTQATNPVANEAPLLTVDYLKGIYRSDRGPPRFEDRIVALVEVIGDWITESERPYRSSPATVSTCGIISRNAFNRLVHECIASGLLRITEEGSDEYDSELDLTAQGWRKYETRWSSGSSEKIGFLAMKFNDESLDEFARTVLKPLIKDRLGFDLIDMRDVAKAGIIDNLMRQQIRDSAFAIVDLSHDNSGAYWEAGYAEGLGKPVIYICEQAKLAETGTHFDTNHSTTLPWSFEDRETFELELVATLRRSLDLF